MTAAVRSVPTPRPRSPSSTKIIPTQPTRAVGGGDPGPGQPALHLGDERPAPVVAHGEPEERPPIAPAAADQHVSRRIDVVEGHRADRGRIVGHVARS